MCPSTFYLIIISFYSFFNAFSPKNYFGSMPVGRVGVEGVHLWAWPQGQQVTYSGPKSHVQLAEMWRTRGWKVTYGPKCNFGVL